MDAWLSLSDKTCIRKGFVEEKGGTTEDHRAQRTEDKVNPQMAPFTYKIKAIIVGLPPFNHSFLTCIHLTDYFCRGILVRLGNLEGEETG